MKSFLKSIFNLLPLSIRDAITKSRHLKRREHIVREWKLKGKPLPPPHGVKQIVIEKFRNMFKADIMVETGTYKGDMVETQKGNFKLIYSIELGEQLYNECKKRFREYNHIKLFLGDSGKVLPVVMKEIHRPALFWLDGHYSGGSTVAGNKNCPVYEELDAIFSGGLNHILLIDDARDFNGTHDYPSKEELSAYILSRKPDYLFEVEDNIIRTYPKQK